MRSKDPDISRLKDHFVREKILLGEEVDKIVDKKQHEDRRLLLAVS